MSVPLSNEATSLEVQSTSACFQQPSFEVHTKTGVRGRTKAKRRKVQSSKTFLEQSSDEDHSEVKASQQGEAKRRKVSHFNERITQKTLRCEDQYATEFELRFCTWEGGIWNAMIYEEIGLTGVQVLKLDYCDLRGEMEGIAQYVTHKRIRELSLICSQLELEDLITFHGVLERYKQRKKIHLRSINLMHVPMKVDFCTKLGEILNLFPIHMHEVNIANCNLTDEHLIKLLEVISDEKRIRKIVLGLNDGIKRQGIQTVVNLTNKCCMEEVDISSCELLDKDLEGISLPPCVRSLVLKGNAGLSKDVILGFVKERRDEFDLDIDECWLPPDDVASIKTALRSKLGRSGRCHFPRQGIRTLRLTRIRNDEQQRPSPF